MSEITGFSGPLLWFHFSNRNDANSSGPGGDRNLAHVLDSGSGAGIESLRARFERDFLPMRYSCLL